MDVPSIGQAGFTGTADSEIKPGGRSRLRGAVDRRLLRMREGMPWVRNANAQFVESYGSIVDIDLGWRMVDSTLQLHQAGQIVLEDNQLESLSDLWKTLTTEIINLPGREEPSDAREMAEGLAEAVRDRLQRMGDEMRRDERSTIRLMHDYETLVDLDLSWRMVEQTLSSAAQGDFELEADREQALRNNWRELTTELVAILGRHQDEVSERPSQEALDNLFEFKLAV
ncbi:MAG: hypothetical protein O3C10_08670 [Chloroflexi bacterium]|nr:hypothetical protein [Chloroflexota bacterium]